MGGRPSQGVGLESCVPSAWRGAQYRHSASPCLATKMYFASFSIIFNYFSNIKNNERGNNMTFPNLRKNEDLINKSILVFAGVLFAFYLDREKCVFSKIAF